MKRRIQRLIPAKVAISLALATLPTALAPWAAAQRTAHAAASHPAIPHFNQPTGNFAFGQNAHHSGFRRFPNTSLPFPFFADFFSPDDLYSTGYPVASQPPIILLQAGHNLAASSDYLQPKNDRERSTPTQPLMIERQNGRYVRVTNTPATGEAPIQAEPCTTMWGQPPRLSTRARRGACAEQPPAAATTAHNLPPALLIFRDGHTEEVRDYAIADGTLYARGDYYTDGYWQKKIALSSLNVPQTLQANTARNVNFILPTSPNEVITRP